MRAIRITAWADTTLDLAVVGFAAWTVAYHVCLVTRLAAGWALAGTVLVLIPCVVVLRRGTAGAAAPRGRTALPRAVPVAVAGAAVAALFAFGSPRWGIVWAAWIVIAAAAAALLLRAREQPAADPAPGGAGVALAWAAALAVLSLLLLRPDPDDAYYLRLSTWVEAHDRFPLRDTMLSPETLPAVFYPPLPSFEALIGSVGWLTPLSASTVAYLLVPPLVAASAVLALWRLLRACKVTPVGVALSVALVFLLVATGDERSSLPGNFFVARAWQGKVVLVAVLAPLAIAHLIAYAERPSARRGAMLAAVGIAAVGLSTTGIFLLPVIAAGCLGPVALRSPRVAAAGFAATAAYPVAAMVATALVGGRSPSHWPVATLQPGRLIAPVFGHGLLAFIAIAAVLLGAFALPSLTAARMIAGTVLAVGLLFAPRVPPHIFDATGLGRPLWRLTWAVPTAALIGAIVAAAAARTRSPPLRAAAVVAAGAVLVAAGTPVWSAPGTSLAAPPAVKRPARDVALARRVVAGAGRHALVLAPQEFSQSLLALSGTVLTVAPRTFYVTALADDPAAHARARGLLQRFVQRLPYGPWSGDGMPSDRQVLRALRVLDVDIACVWAGQRADRRLLARAGYRPLAAGHNIVCTRATT